MSLEWSAVQGRDGAGLENWANGKKKKKKRKTLFWKQRNIMCDNYIPVWVRI